MPDKHIRFSESIIGLSGFLLHKLRNPKTIDELWGEFSKARKNGEFHANHSFEHIVMAVDTLYAIGAVREMDESNGVLIKCD